MLRALKCLVGWHDWRIVAETDAEGSTDPDTAPIDWEPGGVDYLIKCAYCPKSYVHRGRGFWIAPKYPHL